MSTTTESTTRQVRGTAAQPPSSLDSSKHNCNRPRRRGSAHYCGRWTMVRLLNGQYTYVRARCKSYGCPRCGPLKGRLVRHRIAQLAVGHGLQRMVTLTLDPKKLPVSASQKERTQYIRECWRSMRVYLRRKLGKAVAFICVLEYQKNGNPHLHVLVNAFIPKEWLNRAWQALGGGFTFIQFVDLHRVAAYLSKYMSKGWLEEFPEGCRRITASRGLALFARSGDCGHWQLLRQPIDWLMKRSGLNVTEVRLDHAPQGGGPPEIVSFAASVLVLWRQPPFLRASRWAEARFLLRTGRRRVQPQVKVSPITGALEFHPAHLEYI